MVRVRQYTQPFWNFPVATSAPDTPGTGKHGEAVCISVGTD